MEKILNNLIEGFSLSDILDILIVAFIVYKLIGFIVDSRAGQLVKGILVLVALFFLSDLLNLYTLHWLLKSTFTLGVISLVVVFQPELRRALEYMGRSNLVSGQFKNMDREKIEQIISQFVKASDELSQSKTGALIVFERETPLTEIIETGTVINAAVSSQLIGNLFYEGSPLHDGAVVVRGSKLYAAGCVLPLTQNKDLNKSLGTRHRAGIGITENSDSLALIVSEETGIISVAENGKLRRYLSQKTLEQVLHGFYDGESVVRKRKLSFISKIGKEKGGDENA